MIICYYCFFFNDTATTEIYTYVHTLSLHDALPISYRCADGKWISIGSMEPQFYALLLEKIGAADRLTQPQMERKSWPEMQQTLREIFETRTRQQWCDQIGRAHV